MTREEHTALIREIRNNLSDEGKVTDLLTQLSDDYGAITASYEEITNNFEAQREQMESLRETNMRLFLKVGEKPKDEVAPVQQEEEVESLEDIALTLNIR